jgi:RNA polymerase sigma-70 factor (ECF subfamily)
MDRMELDLADSGVRLAIRERSPSVWLALYQDLNEGLLRKARWLLDVPADAEDAVAETWRRALEGADRYDATLHPRNWFVGILVHVCADTLRSPYRQRRRTPESEALAPEDPDPDRVLAACVLRRAVSRLPLRQRVVVRLHFLAGIPVSEIASLLGVRPTMVHNRLRRAIHALGRHLRRAFPERNHGDSSW